MPPVPKVALASPGRVQPWPTSEACWSPAMPQIGGAPGERRRGADRARRVDDRPAAWRRGIRSLLEQRSSQPMVAGSTSAVTPALVASVTWSASDPTPRPRERPGHPAVDGAEAELPASARAARGRPRRGSPSAWWPTRWARGGSPRPAAPGRCRRCAGPASRCPGATGVPLARSHTMVEARWLAIPTPGDRPPVGQRRAGHLEHGVGHARRRRTRRDRAPASRAGQATWCRARRWRRVARWPRARPTCRRRRRGCCPLRALMPRARPEGGGQAELAGVEDPVRVERLP